MYTMHQRPFGLAAVGVALALAALLAGCGSDVTADNDGSSASTAPAITTQPTSVVATTGSKVTLSVAASGGGLSYQWYQNGSALLGSTGPTHTIPSLGASTTGTYYVDVSNSLGSVTSSAVTVTIGADDGDAPEAPKITTQPTSVTTPLLGIAVFGVAASGSDLTYQWYKNGAAISGATDSAYLVNSVNLTNTGTYYVVVKNTVGSVTSNSVTLTIGPGGI